MNAFAFMIDKAKVDSHNWDPPKASMILMCVALLSLRPPSPLSSTVSYSMYLLRVGNASDICCRISYHHIASTRKPSWRDSTTFASDLVRDAAELSEVDDARIGGSTAQDHVWPEDQSCLSSGVKPEKLACQRHMKPFTPGIYGMLQHVITSSALNEDPFCQIYKLYKILLCNTFLQGQHIFPVIHESLGGLLGPRYFLVTEHRSSSKSISPVSGCTRYGNDSK